MKLLTTLLEITIYSAALFAAILLFRALLKKHASPVLLYTIWFLMIARLLMPVTFDSGFHLFTTAGTPATDVSALLDGLNNDVTRNQSNAPVPYQPDESPLTSQDNTETQNAESATASAAMNQSASVPQTPVTWETVLIAVWLAGTAGLLMLAAVSSKRLKRRIKYGSESVPAEWRQSASEIADELHIRRQLRLAMVSGFPTPALSAGLCPVVVLPGELGDEEAVRFALRHELTHLRRGDHIVCLLWLMLRAVYWFNPVVWIAFKLMRMDMETACDSMVTKRMSAGGRSQYAQAVLAMHTKPQVRLALGMALGSTGKTVERRIRGIFMRSRTGHAAKLTALLLALVMAAACFTTACQPAEPVLVNKADGSLASISRTEEPEGKYEAPTRWSETVESKKLRIIFDNDIELPETNVYPVVKVESLAFTQPRIDKLVKYFAGDKKLYLPHIRTKAEYDDEIADAKRGIAFGEVVDKESAEEWAGELKKMRDAAPDDWPIIYTDTTLTYEKDIYGKDVTESGKNSLSVRFDNDDGYPGAIYAGNQSYGNWKSAYFSFTSHFDNFATESMYQNDEAGETDEQTSWAGELFNTFAADKDAAMEKANQVLNDFDIKDMMLVSTERFVVQNAPEKSGYILDFARQAGGIPVYEFGSGGYSKDEEPPAYSSPIGEETVRLRVSKDGIEGFTWSGQSRVVETVTQNAKLLPFEDIQQVVKDSISYRKSFYTRGYVREKAEVKVTSVKLKSAYIGVKDNPNQALIVPAWVIESIFSYDNGGDTETIYNDACVINAIDGGEIGLPLF